MFKLNVLVHFQVDESDLLSESGLGINGALKVRALSTVTMDCNIRKQSTEE